MTQKSTNSTGKGMYGLKRMDYSLPTQIQPNIKAIATLSDEDFRLIAHSACNNTKAKLGSVCTLVEFRNISVVLHIEPFSVYIRNDLNISVRHRDKQEYMPHNNTAAVFALFHARGLFNPQSYTLSYE